MSLSSRIIVRLTITTTVAAAVAYGWLYIKQSRVEAYLRERSLVRQAQEVSSFLSATLTGQLISTCRRSCQKPTTILEADIGMPCETKAEESSRHPDVALDLCHTSSKHRIGIFTRIWPMPEMAAC